MPIHPSLLAAAIGGMLVGAGCASSAPAATNPETAPQTALASGGENHGCKGQNGCKGQGGCKTENHGCKGQNECKGQGGCKSH
jgi:hypothetical protein